MKLLACALLAASLVACGGGGADAGGSPFATSTSPGPAQGATLCGVEVGARRLDGTATDVHDGDTLTLDSGGSVHGVRLQGIDAPELAQPFGSASRSLLAGAVLGRTVHVAYAGTDAYGRIVGTVFTESCRHVNLDLLAAGAAWFYKAYRCELAASLRARFAQAQNDAYAAKAGLWAQADPEAPWYYRNGVEPATPTCADEAPVPAGGPAVAAGGATPVPAGATGSGSGSAPAAGGTPAAADRTCYTGPRGGTYTLTPGGGRNYGGC